jgi:hypothetical protein
MDNSFDELHKLEIENIDNLNEEEIKDPMWKKINYYTSDYWMSY